MSGERSGKKRRVVLVLDEDSRAARQTGLNLHGPHCNVLSSTRYQEGLRIAARQKPDLVLLETTFNDVDGLSLAEKLRQAPETTQVAVAFLTADQSVGKRLKAIRLGALDYIVKPVEGRKLGPRLKALLEQLEQPRNPPAKAVGNDPLQQALERIEQDSASGVLSLERLGQQAQIAFELGVAQRAELGELSGEAALNAIVARTDWRARFVERASSFPGGSDRTPSRPPVRVATDPRASTDHVPRAPEGVAPGRDRVPANPALPPESGLGTVPQDGDEDDVDTDRTVMDPALQTSLGDIVFVGEKQEPARGKRPLDATLREPPAAKELDENTSRLPPEGDSSSYEEDLPTNMLDRGSGPRRTLSHADLLQQVMVPAAADGQPAGGQPASVDREALNRWLGQPDRTALLLVFPQERLRAALRAAAEEAGYTVVLATTSLEAYTAALRLQPVAIISDVRGPKVDGHDLLAAVRSDFAIRELPFLIVSGESLLQQLSAAGPAAFSPILDGLWAALSPRIELEERLAQGQRTLNGRVGPVGSCTLLRALSAARASGRLRLQHTELFSAEVLLDRGMVVEAVVHGPKPSEGAMALLNLVGYEWQEYSFKEEDEAGPSTALGETTQLLSTACQQNNALLDRIYRQGVALEDVAVDRQALDLYLQRMPVSSLKVLVRVVEGERAADLVQQGAASPNLLKSLLHELRRKGVIRLLASDPQALSPSPPLDHLLPSAGRHGRRRTHWFVVLLACVATVLLAAGGYYLYMRLIGADAWQVKSAAPATSVACTTHPGSAAQRRRSWGGL